MNEVIIWHNPKCSKSRETLALLEEHGIKPRIKLYLENPPTEAELKQILKHLKLEPMDIIRKSEAEYKEHIQPKTQLSDTQLIKLLQLYPKLIERPIVIKGKKARIGRPPENILEIL